VCKLGLLTSLLKAHECQKRPNLHTNELNTTFFCSTSPLKAPNRLKPKISLTFRFDKLWHLSKSVYIGENSQILTVSNKKIFFAYRNESGTFLHAKMLVRSIHRNHTVASEQKNSGRKCHFKIWLDCHKLKNFPCLIRPTSTKCQKIKQLMSINVIQYNSDQLFKSNLTFCVVCVFNSQFEKSVFLSRVVYSQ
jgi:hypothetical protein